MSRLTKRDKRILRSMGALVLFGVCAIGYGHVIGDGGVRVTTAALSGSREVADANLPAGSKARAGPHALAGAGTQAAGGAEAVPGAVPGHGALTDPGARTSPEALTGQGAQTGQAALTDQGTPTRAPAGGPAPERTRSRVARPAGRPTATDLIGKHVGPASTALSSMDAAKPAVVRRTTTGKTTAAHGVTVPLTTMPAPSRRGPAPAAWDPTGGGELWEMGPLLATGAPVDAETPSLEEPGATEPTAVQLMATLLSATERRATRQGAAEPTAAEPAPTTARAATAGAATANPTTATTTKPTVTERSTP
jgi:hypothetical protein